MKVENEEAYKLLYPRLTVLVSSGSKKEKNVMTVAWSTPISFNPPLIGVSISPKRHSHKIICETNKFAINVPTEELAEETYYVGIKSGKTIDKEKETNLTFKEGKIGVPIIDECYINIECDLKDKPVYGDHTLFIGKVENTKVKENALDEDGFPKKQNKTLYWRASGDKNDYQTF